MSFYLDVRQTTGPTETVQHLLTHPEHHQQHSVMLDDSQLVPYTHTRMTKHEATDAPKEDPSNHISSAQHT